MFLFNDELSVEDVFPQYEFISSAVLDVCRQYTKSLVIGGSICVAGIYIYSHRAGLTGYAAIGPYPVVEKNSLFRGMQRFIVDKTKEDVSVKFYPMKSMLDAITPRKYDNGHPISGSVRDQARAAITMAVQAAGCKKFELSPAPQSGGGVNSRHQHYAPGDLNNPVMEGEPDDKSIIVGIDIDYYVRSPEELLGYAKPVVLHTFNPTNVSGKDGECRFRITDNAVLYEVSGGGNWKHSVWDWCGFGEFLVARVRSGSWYQWRFYRDWLLKCVGVSQVVYHKVHYSRPWVTCPDRVLVWTIPTHTCWKFDWLKDEMNARVLQRVNYKDRKRPGWNTIVSMDEENKLWISLGRENEDYSVKMLKENFDVLMGLSSSQSVTSRMIGMGYKSTEVLAFVGQYYTGKPTMNEHTRIGRPTGVRVHWPYIMEADEPETSYRSYGSPLVSDHNLVPMIKRWEAMSISIERRVTWVANKKTPNPQLQQYYSEWVNLLVPDHLVGTGIPYTLEEAAEMLCKPSQRLLKTQVWETVEMEFRRLIEGFMKMEPAMKPGRIISSFPDFRFLLEFARYALKFRDEVLHSEDNEHWFFPGHTPAEIAEKVVEFAGDNAEIDEDDYNNFDGTVSGWLQRNVINAPYHRYFKAEFQADLTACTDMLITCPARAKKFNFGYDAGEGVFSGCNITCDGNTILSGGNQYCAVRMTVPEIHPIIAKRLVGPSFGDDGLRNKRFRKAMLKVVDRVGMKIKVEPYVPENGLTFLARVYVDPTVSTTTMQDPLRTWRKLHLTARHSDIVLGSAAVDRVEGYLATDALSPLTSNYCNMIKRYYEELAPPELRCESFEKRVKRKSVNKEKPYWMQTGGAWPQDPMMLERMFKVTANRTGFDESQIRTAMLQLDSTSDPWASFTLNRDEEPTPYGETLDIDSQPCQGAVDDRVIKEDKDVTFIRANPETSVGSSSTVQCNSNSGGTRRMPRSKSNQGSAGPSSVPGRAGGQGEEGNKQHAFQTQRRPTPTGNSDNQQGGGGGCKNDTSPGTSKPTNVRNGKVKQTRGRGRNGGGGRV
nr:MAG: RNA-dependent RNA polymerase [Henan forest noda-like virus 2]